MWFKEELNIKFTKESDIILHRYKIAKFFFILLSLIFSVNIFFVWASFYYNFFIKTVYLTYILLIISFFYYVYFLWKVIFLGKVKNFVFYVLGAICFIIFLILLLPMVFKI